MSFQNESAAPRSRVSIVAERVVPFSAVIVWDALVGPVLAEGWLGRLSIDPVPEGLFSVAWPTDEPHPADWSGRIARIVPLRQLTVSFSPHTELTFRLAADADGGQRVRVRHRSLVDRSEARAVDEFWRRRLGYLAELLHGRPVDWRDAPGD